MAEDGVTSSDIDMSDDQGKVVTMMDVLQEQEAFEEDANAVLGASDDQNCTYSKGYVKRQAIYACLTCCPDAKTDASKRAGVCLACSLQCHESHELIELYTKRLFRCDCGNPKFNGHPCTFTPDKTDFNWDNKYNQNFSGIYCVCHRPYPDPEAVEEEEMLQCIVCEDWLHCNHLEATVPDNDAYAEMICKDCMEDNDFLHDYSELVVNTTDKEVEVIDPDLDVSNLMEAFKKDKLPNGDVDAKEKEEETGSTEAKPDEMMTNGEEKVLETEPSSTVTPESTEVKETPDSIMENVEDKASENQITNPETETETLADTSEKIDDEKLQQINTDVESTSEETKAPEEEKTNVESAIQETKALEEVKTDVESTIDEITAPEETKTDTESSDAEMKATDQAKTDIESTTAVTEEAKTDIESTTAGTEAPEETKLPEEKENITENGDEIKTSENKRKLSTEDSAESSAKKTKVEDIEEKNKCLRPRGVKRCYKGATFWPSIFRRKLCTCGECLDMYKDLGTLFLTDLEDTVTAYEALGKERGDGPASQYEKGLQALSSLDRVQQINALTEYNNMRDKLLDFLKSFKDRKEVVKEEDIKEFFAGMKPKREPDGVYFCR